MLATKATIPYAMITAGLISSVPTEYIVMYSWTKLEIALTVY
jgi:hypothetical protein